MPWSKDKVILQVQVEPKLKAKLREAAKRRQLPLSAWLRLELLDIAERYDEQGRPVEAASR